MKLLVSCGFQSSSNLFRVVRVSKMLSNYIVIVIYGDPDLPLLYTPYLCNNKRTFLKLKILYKSVAIQIRLGRGAFR